MNNNTTIIILLLLSDIAIVCSRVCSLPSVHLLLGIIYILYMHFNVLSNFQYKIAAGIQENYTGFFNYEMRDTISYGFSPSGVKDIFWTTRRL